MECAGCGATYDPAAHLCVDSSWRGVSHLYNLGYAQGEDQLSLPMDRSRDRQYQRIQDFVQEHAACETRPERVYVSERGVTVVDRRRFTR